MPRSREANIPASSINTRSRSTPSVKFEPDFHLTYFGGLVIFQPLFATLNLWERLAACCKHLEQGSLYSHALSLRGCVRDLVLERLAALSLPSITLDFDGSVLSTKRHTEGTAVGFNKHKKGARSYYPLFCTVAQTCQALDMLHHSGNVHDSNGALGFIAQCVERERLPGVRIKLRIDLAFFSDATVRALDGALAGAAAPAFPQHSGLANSCPSLQTSPCMSSSIPEQLRVLWRLAHQRTWISQGQLPHVQSWLEDAGRMIGEWMRKGAAAT